MKVISICPQCGMRYESDRPIQCSCIGRQVVIIPVVPKIDPMPNQPYWRE